MADKPARNAWLLSSIGAFSLALSPLAFIARDIFGPVGAFHLRPCASPFMAHRSAAYRNAYLHPAATTTQSSAATSSSTTPAATKRIFTKPSGPSYESVKTNGTGSFGVVYKAVDTSTQEVVAIKRVLQDKRYKVRCQFVCACLWRASALPCLGSVVLSRYLSSPSRT